MRNCVCVCGVGGGGGEGEKKNGKECPEKAKEWREESKPAG